VVPSFAATIILPRAATLQAMSSVTGGSSPAGIATANGLLPRIASAPPHGTMWLIPPMVRLRPIIPAAAAISAKWEAVPKWLL
jgi:hypothetical protein